MRFALASAVLATFATTVSAASFNVTVGGPNGFVFSPNQIPTAAVGDTVSFLFLPKNHTVTQSTFAAPCQPMANGMDSGFQPVAANATSAPSFTITVNATTPLWFFCRQTGHCEQGMVFAINPTANKTFAAFQAAANASSPNGTPPSSTNTSGSTTTTTGSSSPTTSTPDASSASASASASAKPNGAVAFGVQAGGILAVVGFTAGLLL
ncbi:Cupredoxin [Russula earlei]|uniref:Cupredoxin n=1 Tax=Russula earlei TaxID=71964 RepID=A0ACC0UEX7_9AGAM|nr:Cupredoxin [Russula earlei]